MAVGLHKKLLGNIHGDPSREIKCRVVLIPKNQTIEEQRIMS
jgi:hypothetical protein